MLVRFVERSRKKQSTPRARHNIILRRGLTVKSATGRFTSSSLNLANFIRSPIKLTLCSVWAFVGKWIRGSRIFHLRLKGGAMTISEDIRGHRPQKVGSLRTDGAPVARSHRMNSRATNHWVRRGVRSFIFHQDSTRCSLESYYFSTQSLVNLIPHATVNYLPCDINFFFKDRFFD